MVKARNFRISGLVVGLLAFMLVSLVVPTAQADDANDLVKALSTDRFFISQTLRADAKFNSKYKMNDLENQLRNTVNKLKGSHDTRIVLLTNATIPAQFGGSGARYGDFLLGLLNNPKPEAIVIDNVETNTVSINDGKLSPAERQAIIDDTKSTFLTNGPAAGSDQVAQKAADKVAANETSGTLLTLGIILVVVLAVGGVVAFLLISTQRKWKLRVAGVESLANQVSDQVVRVSDNINFLPDDLRQKTDADFGNATRNFSDANSGLRALQGASPVGLLLKGPDYERKLNLTGSQFEQVRQALSRVEEQSRSLPPMQ